MKLMWPILVVFLSCQAPTDHQNQSLSERQVMDLLLDIQTAKAALEKSLPEQRDSLSTIYWDQIRQIHNLSQSQLDEVLDEISQTTSAYDTLYQGLQTLADSLISDRLNQSDQDDANK